MTSSLRRKRRITAPTTPAANELGQLGAKFFQQFFRGALVAAGLMVGAGQLLAQDATNSILPHYPTSKRQVVAQPEAGGPPIQSSSLKWGAPAKPLPQRSAKIVQSKHEYGAVQPASMNLRVGAEASGVEPAVVLMPAETIVANSPSQVQLAQARNRFQLQPPSRLPSTTAPDVIDGGPSFAGDEPATSEPSLGLPFEEAPIDPPAEPEFSELPPITGQGLPDPGSARNYGIGDDNREMPCKENFRDTNCCQQNSDCREAWNALERNPVRGFAKSFLDITPLYRPDVRYAAVVEADQNKAREQGLARNVMRVWKNVEGKPLGLSEDGTVLGLDGEDWIGEWEKASHAADADIGGIRPLRPAELKGRAASYKPGASEVTITTEEGQDYTLNLAQLSVDDNQWLNGRVWRDTEGRMLARGRFYDYEWNRILVQESSGRISSVPLGKLGEDDLCYVGAYWGEGVGLPAECLLHGEMKIRNFTMITYTWKASGLCHKPLYFEEVQLERYGHTFGPVAQPLVSGAHFFANIAILPYKMGINPVNECQYALGYYRPGDCAPYMIPPVPLSVRAGLYQAGAVTGAIALFP